MEYEVPLIPLLPQTRRRLADFLAGKEYRSTNTLWHRRWRQTEEGKRAHSEAIKRSLARKKERAAQEKDNKLKEFFDVEPDS